MKNKLKNPIFDSTGALKVAVIGGDCAKPSVEDQYQHGRKSAERAAKREQIVLELAKHNVPPDHIREILGILEIW